jgi:hypothetical protein
MQTDEVRVHDQCFKKMCASCYAMSNIKQNRFLRVSEDLVRGRFTDLHVNTPSYVYANHIVIMYNIEMKATIRLISFGHIFKSLLVICTAAVG